MIANRVWTITPRQVIFAVTIVSAVFYLPAWLLWLDHGGQQPGLRALLARDSATYADAVRRAITEPYYDAVADFWRDSPFAIEGYDPLGLDPDAELP